MKKYLLMLWSIIFAVCCTWVGYFTERSDFFQLFTLFGVLFTLYFLLLKYKDHFSDLKWLISSAIVLRLVFLFVVPNLSDDYFRFIWDGRLLSHGNNPFLFLPSQITGTAFATENNLTPEIFNGLNSKSYYTCYPPVHQFIFGVSALLSPNSILGSIIIMRLLIILAEAGTIIVLINLLEQSGMKKNLFMIYAFNPLVIIELTGNLHFEGIVIFFLLLSIYLLIKEKLIFSSVAFSLAVGTKLLPLIFLPLIIRKLGWKNGLVFSLISFGIIAIMFFPFLSGNSINNFFSSIALYFQKFEFNASIYYLVRWVGYQVMGHNIIEAVGVILSALTFFAILYIAVSRRIKNPGSFFLLMLVTVAIYFILATTVHPWYIIYLVAISIFTKNRFPLAWSALCVLSYYTYHTLPYEENLWLITAEYLITGIFLLFEITGFKLIYNITSVSK